MFQQQLHVIFSFDGSFLTLALNEVSKISVLAKLFSRLGSSPIN